MKNTTTIKRTESLAIQTLVFKAIYVTPQCSITGFKLGQLGFNVVTQQNVYVF